MHESSQIEPKRGVCVWSTEGANKKLCSSEEEVQQIGLVRKESAVGTGQRGRHAAVKDTQTTSKFKREEVSGGMMPNFKLCSNEAWYECVQQRRLKNIHCASSRMYNSQTRSEGVCRRRAEIRGKQQHVRESRVVCQ